MFVCENETIDMWSILWKCCHLNATFRCFGCHTKGIPDLGQVMGADVAIALVVPLRCLTPRQINI